MHPIDFRIRAMKLREVEGLQGLEYRQHVDNLVMCYAALADVRMFQLWIGHAIVCWADNDANRVLVMEAWANCPEKFPVWGLRPAL